jgi:hypothetical protein
MKAGLDVIKRTYLVEFSMSTGILAGLSEGALEKHEER